MGDSGLSTEHVTLLTQIDQAILQALSFNELLAELLPAAMAQCGVNRAAVGRIVNDKETDQALLQLAAAAGWSAVDAQSFAAVNLESAATTPVTNAAVAAENAFCGQAAAAQMILPFVAGGSVTGLLVLEHDAELPAETTLFAPLLAQRLAVALQQARLQEEIENAAEAKSHFVSVVTHEMRLPMTSIKGYSDLLGMMGTLSEQQGQFLDIIKRNLTRMSILLSDLSDINYLESKRMRFNLENADLNLITQEAVDGQRPQIDAAEQTIDLQLADPAPQVYGDAKRINQIITNLLSNAIKYSAPKSSLTVRTSQVKDQIQIDVIDTGYGINPDDYEQIWEPFFRSSEDEIRQQSGWGLGLSLAKDLAEALNGSLSFTSVFKEGSHFTLLLPVAAHE